MNKSIALIPIDARPVTYDLPKRLGKLAGWEILTPDKKDLGFMKDPANFDNLFTWMKKIGPKVKGIVLSMDMLLYGGLVPSRVNNDEREVIYERLNKLINLKKQYPKLEVMAFSSTMRISNSYVNEEEKEYWSSYGKEIWTYSYHSHRFLKYGLTEDQAIVQEMERKIPTEILQDYKKTRDNHFTINQSFIQYVREEIFSLLVIPQDDTSEFGLNIYEQEQLTEMVNEQELFDRVLIYPGADEVASVLTARMIYKLEDEQLPTFYPIYSGVKGSLTIARYEDRSLQESVKGQIFALGSHALEEAENADIVLGVNVPGEAQGDHALQQDLHRVDTNDRNVGEWIRKLRYYYEKQKPIAIADVAYANGADPVMIPQLLSKFRVDQLTGFAAWNTAGNTLGTVVAHASLHYLACKKGIVQPKEHEIQLMIRFLDDFLYQSIVRQEVRSIIDEQKERGKLLENVERIFLQRANDFIHHNHMEVKIERVFLPWDRSFEIGIELRPLQS